MDIIARAPKTPAQLHEWLDGQFRMFREVGFGVRKAVLTVPSEQVRSWAQVYQADRNVDMRICVAKTNNVTLAVAH